MLQRDTSTSACTRCVTLCWGMVDGDGDGGEVGSLVRGFETDLEVETRRGERNWMGRSQETRNGTRRQGVVGLSRGARVCAFLSFSFGACGAARVGSSLLCPERLLLLCLLALLLSCCCVACGVRLLVVGTGDEWDVVLRPRSTCPCRAVPHADLLWRFPGRGPRARVLAGRVQEGTGWRVFGGPSWAEGVGPNARNRRKNTASAKGGPSRSRQATTRRRTAR